MKIQRQISDSVSINIEVTDTEIESHLISLDAPDKIRLIEKLIQSIPKNGLENIETTINKIINDNPLLSTLKTLIEKK